MTFRMHVNRGRIVAVLRSSRTVAVATTVFLATLLSVRAKGQTLGSALGQGAVGLETIYKNGSTSVVVSVAMPGPGGYLMDLDAANYDQPLPPVFTYSDGSFDTPFILIDSRPGTPLDMAITRFVRQVRAQAATEASQLEFLRTFMASQLAPLAPNPNPPPPFPPEATAAAEKPVGDYPLATHLMKPVTALESFLDLGHSNCVPKVFFTALIMRRLQIRHRIRSGASQQSGHLWIELSDGRILDPTWQVIGPTSNDGAFQGWFLFSRTYLRYDSVYPITIN